MPEPQKRSPIPLLASVAPIVAALALWVFTRSPFAMVFALIGPVVAVASFGDSRRRSKAENRREHNRFERELVAAIHAVDDWHSEERAELNRLAPSAKVVSSASVRDSERWRGDLAQGAWVRVGTGLRQSTTQLQGESTSLHDSGSDAAIQALYERAAMLAEAPITVDATLGIGVYGARAQSRAVVNAVIVQLAHSLSPMEFDTVVDRGAFDWVLTLPHSSTRPTDASETGISHRSRGWGRVAFRLRNGTNAVIVATAADENSLPLDCRVVIQVLGSAARLVRHPKDDFHGEFAPEYLSDSEALAFALVQRAAAKEFVKPLEHSLTTNIDFAALSQTNEGKRHGLSGCLGVDSAGPLTIDLVKDGPHAIVGGTTGSGKSELLITWILAIASSHSIAEVNFLLVDFKGGAAFSAVSQLPHTVGMLTDLDDGAARRAIVSLRAELRRRERILAEANARSIEDFDRSTRLARLVIVVDEFATLTDHFPDLHELFADLAARGRSLGIHLILCTQRPAASVRDTVLANCSLRVSLRVTNQADSIAVVGTSGAARLPRSLAGRALLSRGGSEPELVQFAMASHNDVAMVMKHTEVFEESLHRPWLDPLPHRVLPADVLETAAPALVFGILDLPDEQRRAPAIFDPMAQGNLMILGGHRSGKSGALAALAHHAANPVLLPNGIEGAWDTVTTILDSLKKNTKHTLLLIDNVDELLIRFPADYESTFADHLIRLAREGPRLGVNLVLTASGTRGRLQSLAVQCESTLLLRMPSKQEHTLAGGAPADYEPNLPPGAGMWRGQRVQIVFHETPLCSPNSHTQELSVSPGTRLAVISSRPAQIRSQLERLGAVTLLSPAPRRTDELTIESRPTLLLGDPDSWQAAWALLAELRSETRLAFHDCSPSDFRAITRGRSLPPPVDSSDTLVVLEPDGQMYRALLAP